MYILYKRKNALTPKKVKMSWARAKWLILGCHLLGDSAQNKGYSAWRAWSKQSMKKHIFVASRAPPGARRGTWRGRQRDLEARSRDQEYKQVTEPDQPVPMVPSDIAVGWRCPKSRCGKQSWLGGLSQKALACGQAWKLTYGFPDSSRTP